MANPKRASMREGPLAALFRKTELDGEDEAPPAAAPPARERIEESEPPAAAREQTSRRPLPHPALEAHGEHHDEEIPIPSPKERLRNVFSADIPGDMMERPGIPALPREYVEPALATSDNGQPVIRVVGVGGGGVNAVNRMVEAEVE